MVKKKLSDLQQKIGYTFKNEEYLVKALTHSSYVFENGMDGFASNERMEFLGDGILEAVSSEYLYNTYPEKNEGGMSRLRSCLVCEENLALCAKSIDLGNYLILGKGEEKSGGRNRASVTSDCFEAVIGAIYLDGGFTNAKEFILKYVLVDIEQKKLFFDSKTILQEFSQKEFKCTPEYKLINESGPDHMKSFEVSATILGKVVGVGKGATKKGAEKEAAYDALLRLQVQVQV